LVIKLNFTFFFNTKLKLRDIFQMERAWPESPAYIIQLMKDLTTDRSSPLIEANEEPGLIQNPQPVEPVKKTRQLIAPVHKPNQEHNHDLGWSDRGDPDYTVKKTRQLIGPVQKPTKQHNRD
jgi:hypothetical protein